MSSEISSTEENGVLSIGIRNGETEYLLWQFVDDESELPYFEYNDQINGGYGITKTVTVDDTGCLVELNSGESVELNWQWPLYGDIDRLITILKNNFTGMATVIDAQGFYRK
jgi:hypothetical protein